MTKPRRKPRRVKSKAKPRKTVRLAPRAEKPAPTIVYDDMLGAPIMIPHGVAYQWVAATILGQDATHDRQQAVNSGWQFVPFKRHAKEISPHTENYGRIIVGGLILMEAPAEVAAGQVHEGISRAHKLAADANRMIHNEGGDVLLSASIIAGDYARISPDAPPLDVEAAITVSLSASEQDTASALGISPHEYVRRKLAMEPGVLYPILEFPRDLDAPPMFEFWPFPFTLTKSAK